jgi:hypothetical protein
MRVARPEGLDPIRGEPASRDVAPDLECQRHEPDALSGQ